MKTKYWLVLIFGFISYCMMALPTAWAARDYLLGAGDVLRITVFQNPDLTQELRVSDLGEITFPLIGSVKVQGLTPMALERVLADKLRSGGFLLNPQVNVVLMQAKGSQVIVLGYVRSPGKYPLEVTNLRVSDALALANGILPDGNDVVYVTGIRDGLPYQKIVDMGRILKGEKLEDDVVVMAGDVIHVAKAALYYIYGEVQRPGAWKVEKNMTLRQAIAFAGGLTPKGTLWRMKVRRRDQDGQTHIIDLEMDDIIMEGDTIEIKESWF